MRYLIFLFVPVLLAACSNPVTLEETSYEGRPHILVRTKALDYYYDVRGGGFSRIVDREGNDWVGFRMEPWGIYPAFIIDGLTFLLSAAFIWQIKLDVTTHVEDSNKTIMAGFQQYLNGLR